VHVITWFTYKIRNVLTHFARYKQWSFEMIIVAKKIRAEGFYIPMSSAISRMAWCKENRSYTLVQNLKLVQKLFL
jgi:hypothetical protein